MDSFPAISEPISSTNTKKAYRFKLPGSMKAVLLVAFKTHETYTRLQFLERQVNIV